MPSINVQLKNTDGEVVEEKVITVSEGDKLIMQFPKTMPVQTAHSAHKTLVHSLESPSTKVIGMPEGLTFQVISFK